MGRITVFSGEDLHSKQVMAALKARSIPFTEISVLAHPQKRKELVGLTSQCSVPQVFFNTRNVGGVNETTRELKAWDKPSSMYRTPLERYQQEIEKTSNPAHPVFQIPTETSEHQNETVKPSNIPIIGSLPIKLPDGTATSVGDITKRLKNSLPATDLVNKNVVYKSSFTGKTAVDGFKQALGISVEEAIDFGNHLLDEKIIHPLTSETSFVHSDKAIYRLQCFMRPDVLNSHRIWKDASRATYSDVYKALDRLMCEIETEIINDAGLMDYSKAILLDKFSKFEDAVCELQVVRVADLKPKEKLVFGINIYNLMIKYAFMKLGVPTTEAARHALVSKAKFTVDGTVYTLDQWIRRFVMESGAKQKPVSMFAPSAMKRKTDIRIHFAMNMGAIMGCSTSPPFRSFSVENILQELDTASRVFLEDKTNLWVDEERRQVVVSKLVDWNSGDFSETDRGLLGDLAECLVGTHKMTIQKALSNKNTKVVLVDPDYTRNACNFKTFNDLDVKVDVKGMKAVFYRFRTPPKPKNEELRLATLRSLSLLDSMPEERFDRITGMVRAEFQVPLVFISLLDSERQWFKSQQWYCSKVPSVSETSRDVSFCGHAILGSPRVPMWIEDATEDDRFADNPLVTGPLGIRFYAGCPLSIPAKTGELVNIGVLCVLDTKPRQYDEKTELTLQGYARQVEREVLKKRTATLGNGGDAAVTRDLVVQ